MQAGSLVFHGLALLHCVCEPRAKTFLEGSVLSYLSQGSSARWCAELQTRVLVSVQAWEASGSTEGL